MAQQTVLTAKLLASIKPAPAGKRLTIWDGKLSNFGLRVTDSGVVSFIVMRRLPGQKTPVRVTLGRYPSLSLADARQQAGDAIAGLAVGQLPSARKAIERAPVARQTLRGVAHCVERFLTEHADDKRTGRQIRQLLETKVLPRWKGRTVESISKGDIVALIHDVRQDVRKRRKQDGSETARQTLIYLKSFFSWAEEADLIAASPAASLKLSGGRSKLLPPKRHRDRVLTDQEILALWNATDGDDYPFSPYVRLLLILGVRRGELSGMRREEIDLDAGLWRLSGERTKNQEPRVVFLPAMAVDILRSLPEHSSYIFTTSGQRPISGFTKLKSQLDKRAGVAAWRLHDLRRTMRTGLSSLQIPHLVAELAIGHKLRGLDAVYDQHRYERELRDALDRWCAKLRSIVDKPPDNVVSLPHRAA